MGEEGEGKTSTMAQERNNGIKKAALSWWDLPSFLFIS